MPRAPRSDRSRPSRRSRRACARSPRRERTEVVMAGTLGGRGKKAPITGINVTPMVDVVLVLLVIMMVSAIYIVSQSLKVELPKTASSDGAANTPLSVTVTKAGAYLFNQKPIEEGRLRVELDRKSTRLNSSHVEISY